MLDLAIGVGGIVVVFIIAYVTSVRNRRNAGKES